MRIAREYHMWVVLCRRGDEAVLECVCGCGRAARDVQLEENVGDVPGDGLFAEVQGVADTAIGPARRNQAQYLQFAGGQTGRPTRGFNRRAQTGEIELCAERVERPARGLELEIGAVFVPERTARLRDQDLCAGCLVRYFQLAPQCQRSTA